MNIFKTAFGIAAAIALIPYKAKVSPSEENEGSPKNVTVESLVYRIEVTAKKNEDGTTKDGHDVNVVIPADGIKKVVSYCKEKFPTVKEKAAEAKEKINETASNLREKCAAKRAAKGEESSEEEITVEVISDDSKEKTPTSSSTKKTTQKAKS